MNRGSLLFNIRFFINTKKAHDIVMSPSFIYGCVAIRTNERSRSPDDEAGLHSWDTYGRQP